MPAETDWILCETCCAVADNCVVMAEAFNELVGQNRVGVHIYFSDNFFRVPGHANLTAWIARGEEALQLFSAVVVEAFVGFGEQAPAPAQQVALAAR